MENIPFLLDKHSNNLSFGIICFLQTGHIMLLSIHDFKQLVWNEWEQAFIVEQDSSSTLKVLQFEERLVCETLIEDFFYFNTECYFSITYSFLEDKSNMDQFL